MPDVQLIDGSQSFVQSYDVVTVAPCRRSTGATAAVAPRPSVRHMAAPHLRRAPGNVGVPSSDTARSNVVEPRELLRARSRWARRPGILVIGSRRSGDRGRGFFLIGWSECSCLGQVSYLPTAGQLLYERPQRVARATVLGYRASGFIHYGRVHSAVSRPLGCSDSRRGEWRRQK